MAGLLFWKKENCKHGRSIVLEKEKKETVNMAGLLF